MSGRWTHWQARGRELFALGRQATMLFDANEPDPEVATLTKGSDVVVCLHGLFANAGVLQHLRRAIRPVAPTLAMSYPVGPGIDTLTNRLASLVGSLPDGVRIHLVGHSVGGLIARHYLDRAGRPEVVQTISIASPFAGLHGARLVGLPIALSLIHI